MRLIDSDGVVKGLNRWENKLIQTYGENDEFVRCIDRIIDNYIDSAPTIDAEPVRHGHWINKRSSVYCSRCGKGYRNGVGTISAANHNYCPNCGADMRGGDNT